MLSHLNSIIPVFDPFRPSSNPISPHPEDRNNESGSGERRVNGDGNQRLRQQAVDDVASGIHNARQRSVDASTTSVTDYARSETRPRHRRALVSGTCTIKNIAAATVVVVFVRLSSLSVLQRRVPIFHDVRQGGSERRRGGEAFGPTPTFILLQSSVFYLNALFVKMKRRRYCYICRERC